MWRSRGITFRWRVISGESHVGFDAGVDPERKRRIIDVLDVDVDWRMHKVSDGQRRRVQLAWGLMLPYKVLLLDEITVAEVLGRAS